MTANRKTPLNDHHRRDGPGDPVAILQKKAGQERLAAPAEVLDFIASRVTTSIRDLDDALIRVTAFASLNRSLVDLAIDEEVLTDFISDGSGLGITAD